MSTPFAVPDAFAARASRVPRSPDVVAAAPAIFNKIRRLSRDCQFFIDLPNSSLLFVYSDELFNLSRDLVHAIKRDIRLAVYDYPRDLQCKEGRCRHNGYVDDSLSQVLAHPTAKSKQPFPHQIRW